MSIIKEPDVTLDLALEHGLTEEEYGMILTILGRTPTLTELGIYSVMWSEHCSYKNSIAELKTLPRSKEAGKENAGIVPIGDGLLVAFKIESHNHPSAVEPYQGAATGVGGIHRDIFTMGARPVAALNSLRFGPLSSARVRYLIDGVVRGIGDYGNSFGVPTLGGEVYFSECYTGNPLVNAMSVGIVEERLMARAIATGIGNAVIIVGSSTGRDGIHGATFASEEISEASEAKRPSVQVGDPFAEKLLLEATLEAIGTGAVLGIQDMGAAGLTCSSCEMSAKGVEETGIGGMELYLEKVPIREKGMTPYEIMLSESQERMLIVAHQGREQEIISLFKKWDVNAEIIGKVTGDGRVKVFLDGELKADVPAESLVLGGGAPVYIRPAQEKKPNTVFPILKPDNAFNLPELILGMLSRPNIANKAWVYNQYDSMVRTNTVTPSGKSDSAVIRIKGTTKGLAMKVDCNGKYVYLNPRRGAEIAVAESTRNVACSGARPLGITNCLNFGNPMKPEIYFQFREAVAGMGNACRTFGIPVTGGNVSFYNETKHGNDAVAVYPTPTIGTVGVIDQIEHQLFSSFRSAGDAIYLVGLPLTDSAETNLNGSEFIEWVYGELGTDAPQCDLDIEKKIQDFLLHASQRSLIEAVHDISDGGLITALCEMSLFNFHPGNEDRLGFSITHRLPDRPTAIQEWLFSETQGRLIVAVAQEKRIEFETAVTQHHLPFTHLGEVKINTFDLDLGNDTLSLQPEEMYRAYYDSLAEYIESY